MLNIQTAIKGIPKHKPYSSTRNCSLAMIRSSPNVANEELVKNGTTAKVAPINQTSIKIAIVLFFVKYFPSSYLNGLVIAK